MTVDPRAGQLPDDDDLVDVGRLLRAYREHEPSEPVAFGTSGHRGTSLDGSFTEAHVTAIGAAVCRYRSEQGTSGPLYLGRDPHALSEPAFRTIVEVLVGHGVEVVVDAAGGFKPNPPHGGPADTDVTGWIEREANRLLEAGLDGVPRVPFDDAGVTG